MHKRSVMKTWRQLLWLCFELLSWSSNWLPSSGNGVPLIYIHGRSHWSDLQEGAIIRMYQWCLSL